jgi:aspartyl-tRNA(Asn)/glutamyl-tRNA(Gln) amidotransferase subunit B
MRIEPNVSVRPVGSQVLGTRVEVKNLNSFRALERSVAYEIERQAGLLRLGQVVRQETVGWDDALGVTFPQRVKEGEDDYRYFPEPDLPPLVLDEPLIERVRLSLPELPAAKLRRFQTQYGLSAYDAGVLVAEPAIAKYYEQVIAQAGEISPKVVANWVTGELFGLMNTAETSIEALRITPQSLAELIVLLTAGKINAGTAKTVLAEMFDTGNSAGEIIAERGLQQISDAGSIAPLVVRVLEDHPEQVQAYLNGKEALLRWLFGQVMRLAAGQANPQVVQKELERQLAELGKKK